MKEPAKKVSPNAEYAKNASKIFIELRDKMDEQLIIEHQFDFVQSIEPSATSLIQCVSVDNNYKINRSDHYKIAWLGTFKSAPNDPVLVLKWQRNIYISSRTAHSKQQSVPLSIYLRLGQVIQWIKGKNIRKAFSMIAIRNEVPGHFLSLMEINNNEQAVKFIDILEKCGALSFASKYPTHDDASD